MNNKIDHLDTNQIYSSYVYTFLTRFLFTIGGCGLALYSHTGRFRIRTFFGYLTASFYAGVGYEKLILGTKYSAI